MRLARQVKTAWHRWFAWHPVAIDGHWVWLESVERRLVEGLVFADHWQYRVFH